MTRTDAGMGALPPGGGRRDWIRRAAGVPGCERIEAYFSGRGYEMHRHDTYAIGHTASGVQSFHYRGAVRNSLPGGTIVLHPDEPHDGQAGADGGFRYRMLYIEPALIQQALGGRQLPFVHGGISGDPRLFAACSALVGELDHPMQPLEYEDAICALADALVAASDDPDARPVSRPDYRSAETARRYLHETPEGNPSMAQLEAVTGRDRWSLSRDFRRLFGTSPHRYLVMRRLAMVKAALHPGASLAQLAADAGFFDQSHMTRHFSKAFGVTPGQWVRMLAA